MADRAGPWLVGGGSLADALGTPSPRLPPCELGSWDDPDREQWIAALAEAVRRAGRAPVLIAHSLGCLAVAWWANRAGAAAAGVAAALFVAPPDVERTDAEPRLRRFAPAPVGTLPFPALVVASRTDPYASIEASAALAARWSAGFVDAGELGHINAASGLGMWPRGQALVEALLEQSA